MGEQFPSNQEVASEVNVAKKEIKFPRDLFFRQTDGSFQFLTKKDQEFTKEDADRDWSPQDKVNFSLNKLMGGIAKQLNDPAQDMPGERKAIIESLIEGKPAFIPLDKGKINETFVKVSEQFLNSASGVILFPEYNKKSGEAISVNYFSAIQHSDGRIARIMRGKNQEDLSDFVDRINFLTPKTEANSINEKETAYAMEFIKDGQRPENITQEEMEDWLKRVNEGGLIFGFDVGKDDDSLDNFIRKDGKLFWVDGNIMGAKLAESNDQLEGFIEEQRSILMNYIKK